jgi:2,3-bisphosphoglycerate-dependent phosphoglycerate mutase
LGAALRPKLGGSRARATRWRSLDQLTRRAVDAVRALARENHGRVVLAAGHGTFISRALSGFGMPVDWTFWQRMPMPAIYRLRFADPSANPALSEARR